MIYGVDCLGLLVRDYKIVEGEFLSSDRGAYDIVLVKCFADDKEIRLGNEVMFTPLAALPGFAWVGLMDKDGPGQLNNGASAPSPGDGRGDSATRETSIRSTWWPD